MTAMTAFHKILGTFARRSVVLPLAFALLLAGTLLQTEAKADDPKAREIMQKVNDRDDGDNQTSDMEMILIDNRNKRRSSSWKSLPARASIFVDSVISVSYISL